MGIREKFKNDVEKLKEWELYEQTMNKIDSGKVIKAKVVKVTNKDVIVDINFKSEGIIPLSQFISYSGECNIKVNDEIDVFLQEKEDSEGNVVLSKIKADKLKFWDRMEEAYAKEQCVEGNIVQQTKGGFKVDIGMESFLPASQLDLKPVPLKNFNQYVGKVYKMQIIKVNKKRRNIILSRKAFLEIENEKIKQEALTTLKVGELKKGLVKNITDYGAFINLGGIDGLLHITDMAWGEVKKASDIVSQGQEIEVMILAINPETKKISLGLKQKTQNPWLNIEEKYALNTKYTGEVIGLANYGIFVKLENGLEGLLHLSEISWTKKAIYPSNLFSIGDKIDVVILSIDKESRKIYLGIKQLTENPWKKIDEKYPVGTEINGIVRSLSNFGAFVEIEKDIEGLLHIKEMKKFQDIEKPNKMLNEGDKIKVIILSIDKDSERIALGLTLDTNTEIKQEKQETENTIEQIAIQKTIKRTYTKRKTIETEKETETEEKL
ncbi:MAG: S1 RNA-binding domain-containing protein [bacterium]